MCSVQEDGATMPENRPDLKESKTCMKCGEPAVVIIRGADPLCRTCFIFYCTHKFRAAFGKSRVVRDGELALVALSGGNNSSAMLHLIQEGKSPRAHRKLRFQPSVLYIDEGATLGLPVPEREANTRKMVAMVAKTGLPVYVCNFEQVLNESFLSSDTKIEPYQSLDADDVTAKMAAIQLHEGECQQLTKLLQASKTLTAKENLIGVLRQRLLVAVARKTGHTKVLVGDSSTRLAVNMLSDITQGHGAHVALEMSFADCRYGDVTIVRPMREFIAKETAVYNRLNEVETYCLPSVVTKMPCNASLSRLTEEFLAGLQANHPRTIPTVFRTGEKLGISDLEGSAVERCTLCQAPLDTDVRDSSALRAIEFSQTLSSKKLATNPSQATPVSEGCCTKGGTASNTDCCREEDGSCQNTQTRVTREDITKILCYGCRLVLRDLKDISALPASVLSEASKARRRQDMKESIQEFLLEDANS